MADSNTDDDKTPPVNPSLKKASITRIVELVRTQQCTGQWGRWLKVPLELAAAGGDKELAKELVSAGSYGDPISAAIRARQYDVVQHLRQNPDDKHLRLAVEHRDEAMVSLLLELGADANPEDCRDDNGVFTPLLMAAKSGQLGIVGLLMDAGADATRRARQNNEPTSDRQPSRSRKFPSVSHRS